MNSISASLEKPKGYSVFFVAFVIALSLVFHVAIYVIVKSWQQDEYSYGFLIPILTLMLLLDKMREIDLHSHASWKGFSILAICVVANGLFQVGGIRGILPQVYLLALLGAFITFWGPALARKMAGPLGFMLFCAPLPKFFYYTLSFKMQMLSTSLGTGILELLNVPVFQDGNIIDLGGYKLQVAEACNGLRYLFPLVTLSYLVAYMYKGVFLKRVILFLSSIPITVIMNSLRIAFIGVTVNQWGSGMAEGAIHEFEGGMVFIGCIICLAAEIGILQLIGRKGRLDFDWLSLPRFSCFIAPATGKPVAAASFVIAIALVITGFVHFTAGNYLRNEPLKQSFATFPMKIGPWIGHFSKLDAVSLSRLDTDDYLLADYMKSDTYPVNLYALYYSHQDSTGNESNHSPAVCIPGGGWTIESNHVQALTLNDGKSLAVNKVIISKDTQKQVVYYWFIQGGRPTWDANLSKFYQVQNAIQNGVTNGAMVRLVTTIGPHETDMDAERRLTDFLNAGLATINGFMFTDRK